MRARQHLEERVATGEADAGLLRSSLQETRRQLDVASQQRVHRESAFELRRQEFDARSASDSRRCAALERRVEALQQELLKLSDSVADGNASGGSAAIRTSQQLSWYSEQLQTSQQTARRLQSEVDQLSRENFQLTEQSSFAREQLAKSARSTSMAFDNSPPRTGSGGGGRPGASNLTVVSEQLSESIMDLQHSRQLASARASELGRLQYASISMVPVFHPTVLISQVCIHSSDCRACRMQKNLTPAEVVAQRRAAVSGARDIASICATLGCGPVDLCMLSFPHDSHAVGGCRLACIPFGVAARVPRAPRETLPKSVTTRHIY